MAGATRLIAVRQLAEQDDDELFPIVDAQARVVLRPGETSLNRFQAKLALYEYDDRRSKLKSIWKLDKPAAIIVTDQRVAFVCQKYDTGSLWIGGGAAVVLTVGSKAIAAAKRRGKAAVGQIEYSWLTHILHIRGSLGGGSLMLKVTDGDGTFLTLELKSIKLGGTNASLALAESLFRRALTSRLEQGPELWLNDEEIAAHRTLLVPGAIAPTAVMSNGSRWTLPTSLRVGSSPERYAAARASAPAGAKAANVAMVGHAEGVAALEAGAASLSDPLPEGDGEPACSSCGELLEADEQYCTACGHAVVGDAGVTATASVPLGLAPAPAHEAAIATALATVDPPAEVVASAAPAMAPASGEPSASASDGELADCAACGAQITSESAFCTRCGAAASAAGHVEAALAAREIEQPLPSVATPEPTAVCARCGGSIPAEARYCIACGAAAGHALEERQPEAAALEIPVADESLLVDESPAVDEPPALDESLLVEEHPVADDLSAEPMTVVSALVESVPEPAPDGLAVAPSLAMAPAAATSDAPAFTVPELSHVMERPARAEGAPAVERAPAASSLPATAYGPVSPGLPAARLPVHTSVFRVPEPALEARVTCRSCGASEPAGVAHCGMCGALHGAPAAPAPAAFCGDCGTGYESPSAAFCTVCGTRR